MGFMFKIIAFVLLYLYGVILLPFYITISYADSNSEIQKEEESFSEWLENYKSYAIQNGIDKNFIKTAFQNIKAPLKRVLKSDKKQAEFVLGFWKYFQNVVTNKRIQSGTQYLNKNFQELQKAFEKYGVPKQYLIALWAVESNFGSYTGKVPVLHALATLAYDKRRRDFFEKELLLALKIFQKGDIHHTVNGSWAGAMGAIQFMPSTFHHYAVDGDNDNKIDLWENHHDIFSSAAHFLKNIGWKQEQLWGRQIILPKNFDYKLIGINKPQTLTFWHNLDIKKIGGGKLGLSNDIKGSVILPAGHQGPAFLVYDNFKTIMRWNNSVFYALSVAILADKIINRQTTSFKIPNPLPLLKISDIKRLQIRLNNLGFSAGKPDGILGTKTKKAIRLFQDNNNLIADGYPNMQVFKLLNIY